MDKPALRNALKKLRAIPFDRDVHAHVMMAPQEMLDYLAMLAGNKPVCLIGRGFDDPKWIEGVTQLAQKAGLKIVEGASWDAAPVNEKLPDWFREELAKSKPTGPAPYICRARGTADAVEATFTNPPVTMEEEARLLGYPACCVRAHYERDALFDQTFYMLVERAGGGDINEIQRILREDVAVSPETPDEMEAFKRATEFTPAPFTSFHMCAACTADPNSPARQLSKQYEELAHTVDERLAAEVAANQEGVGRND